MTSIAYDITAGVATIRINRPEKRNAFTLDMLARWTTLIDHAWRDDAVNVLVITGTDGAFCAGVDLEELESQEATPLSNKRLLTDHVHTIAYALERMDKPVIAAINGVAVGAGMDVTLMCDIRLAAASARFSEGYVRIGLVPGDGGCYLLPRVVGMSRALELLWSGDFVDAGRALEIGLVDHVVPDDTFEEDVANYAARLASGPSMIQRIIKRAAYQSARTDLRTALDLISSHQAVIQSTTDSKEAFAAFKERRRPEFNGR